MTKVLLDNLLHALEHNSRDLLCRLRPPLDLHHDFVALAWFNLERPVCILEFLHVFIIIVLANHSFSIKYYGTGVERISVLRVQPDIDSAIRLEADPRRSRWVALGVVEDFHLLCSRVVIAHARESGAQINANHNLACVSRLSLFYHLVARLS